MRPGGLTGAGAGGKTTVCRLFEAKGCAIVDADVVAHILLLRGQAGYEAVVRAVGRAMWGEAGDINRSKLAAQVFNDRNLLDQLNRLVHPEVIRTIDERLAALRAKDESRVIVDASLMIESGFHRSFRRLVLVMCTLEQQVE